MVTLSKFDPEILAKVPEEQRGPVTEEMARLSKENDALREENKEIADTIYAAIFQAEEELENFHGHFSLGPFYFSYMMNELAIGPYMCISDGCLSLELNFLFFTFGIIIPIGGGKNDDPTEQQ